METERQLVNGGALRSFLGKQVQIYLKVDRLTPGGQQFTGTSSDQKIITVNMDVALNQPLNDWIEVIGTATTPIALSCEEIIVIGTDDESEPFDEEAHNLLIVTMQNMNNFYETGESNGFH